MLLYRCTHHYYDHSVKDTQMLLVTKSSQVRDVARNLTEHALHPTSGKSGILVSQIQMMRTD